MANANSSEIISGKKPGVHRVGFVIWLLLCALLVPMLLYPIAFGQLRIAILAGIFLVWAGALWLFGRLRMVRVAGIGALLVVCYFLLGPGREENPRPLRQNYLSSLRSFEGTTYLWGGESSRGIDCSGLVRCGYIKANFNRAIETANPAPMRTAFSLWLFDSSAKAMGEEYRGRTKFVMETKSLNELDYGEILPGDIAVTKSGIHTLAYLGDKTWIQADPKAWKVIQARAPGDNAWFSQPMKIVRWRELDPRTK